MASNTKKNKTKPKTSKKKGKEKEALTVAEGITWTFAVVFLLCALVMILSYTSFLVNGPAQFTDPEANWLGDLGTWVTKAVFEDTFGCATYLLPVFLFAVVMRLFRIGRVRLWKWFINCAFLMVWLSTLGAYLQQFSPFESFFHAGGMHGIYMLHLLKDKTGPVGTFFILIVAAVIYVLYLSGETIRTIRRAIAAARRQAEKRIALAAQKNEGSYDKHEHHDQGEDEQEEERQNNELAALPVATPTTIEFEDTTATLPSEPTPEKDMEMEIEIAGEQEENDEQPGTEHNEEPNAEDTSQHQTATDGVAKVTIGTDEPEAQLGVDRALEPYDPKLDLENYKYPTIDLLKKYDTKGSPTIDMEEQQTNKNQILTLFSEFGVEITSIKATIGPTVTLYEITPAPGIRISKIRNLEDEIALRLRAMGIRIIAPIPGKGTIGIEVPNAKPQMVSMESLINSRKFQETDYELPMALGKTITNEIFMVDLTKMPHLLVAGATGQGKSVGLNAIITSLLYKKHPAELKLVMVDPKKVEFSVYYPIINHFLAQVESTEDTEDPIITDTEKVKNTLKSLCLEMDTRYDLLKKARARNVKEYNAKFKDRQLNPQNGHRFMPYIVVIIDEFGDLIMTAGKEIEMPITRIAQLARAVGIHMIIATQRPSTNIITGSIRANFPARMAFKVSSMIDSRIILDRPGANHLVGKGDMLFLAGNEPVRVQCAFVDTPEVEALAKHIACQQSYPGPFLLPAVPSEDKNGESDFDRGNEALDPMFEEVARLVVATQQGSTSMIQRKFSIGYNRAGRLMDQLEKAGIVGPTHGSKPREVLCASDVDLDMRLNDLR